MAYLKKLHAEIDRTLQSPDKTIVVDKVLYRHMLVVMIQTCNEIWEDVSSPEWWARHNVAEGPAAPQ